jgi:hypothetical protein
LVLRAVVAVVLLVVKVGLYFIVVAAEALVGLLAPL